MSFIVLVFGPQKNATNEHKNIYYSSAIFIKENPHKNSDGKSYD